MKKLVTIASLAIFSVSVFAGSAKEIIEKSGISGGIIIHLDCNDGKFTSDLLINEKYIVQGLDIDQQDVDTARQNIKAQGKYGKVTVSRFDGKKLPYADNLVNLIVADSRGDVSKEEILRVLVPNGIALIGDEKISKPWPEEIDEWGHFLHGPDNNAVAQDNTISLPRNLQWVSGPKWMRSHEEFSSISVAVSSGGRIFYIVDKAPNAYISFDPEWHLVARDAFNGTLLWERVIPVWNDHMRHFRSGPAHLPRRLIAVGDRVYTTLGLNAPLSEIDAKTGKTIQEYKDTEWAEEVVCSEGKLYVLVGSSEGKRFGAGLHFRDEPDMRKERFLVVFDAKSGKELWRKNAKDKGYILPQGIALCNGNLYFHSIQGLGCLDAENGDEKWFSKRPTLAARYGFSTSTLVATPEVILLADYEVPSKAKQSKTVAESDVQWGVGGWSAKSPDPDLYVARKGKSKVSAYSAKDGQKLWEAPCSEGYNAPVDVFVVDETVWLGPYHRRIREKIGYDLKTGAVKKKLDIAGEPVGMVHDRCYRNKATTKYVFSCRDGIEIHDFEKGWVRNNSWTRGPCQFGIMPANGLLYAPPDPCACHLKTRMQGFKAYSSQKLKSVGRPVSETGRIKKGVAYGKLPELAKVNTGKEDWPSYRHDSFRTGIAKSKVKPTVERKWSTTIGGKLTQPVIAGGKVYVASVNQNSVYALDSDSGNILWQFTAEGKIDSAPTIYKGMLLFGSSDGKVYCLDASNGELGWSFLAAPEERLISSFGSLESTWPVHGSVIIRNSEVVFTAGRSSYLGGGLYYYRLNPVTGKMISSNVITHIDPKTEKQLGAKERGFDSDGVVSDLLSTDGENVFLKHLQITEDGAHKTATAPHLFSPTSILDDVWFIRTYWTFGPTIVGAGWGGWAKTANRNPSGRLLAFNDDTVFGYGRIKISGGASGHRNNKYHLFASPSVYSKPEAKVPTPKGKGKKSKRKRAPSVKKTFNWSVSIPFTAKAMAVTPDQIIMAGVPDLGKRAESGNTRHQFVNAPEAKAAFKGKKGASLWFSSTKDGAKLFEKKIDSPPVIDGLSVANGKVFVSLKNGNVECFK